MESNDYLYYMSEISKLMPKARFVSFREKQHVCPYLGIDGSRLLPTNIDTAIREAAAENEQLLEDVYTTKSDLLPEIEKIVRTMFDLRMSLLQLVAAGYENIDLLNISEDLGEYWVSLNMDLGGYIEAEHIDSLVRICEKNLRSGFGIPKCFVDEVKSRLKDR